jgi:hypothetical protein
MQIRTPAGVTAGDVIEGTVAVSLQRAPLPEAADENEAVTVDVSIVVETQGPRGEKFHEIARFAKSVRAALPIALMRIHMNRARQFLMRFFSKRLYTRCEAWPSE